MMHNDEQNMQSDEHNDQQSVQLNTQLQQLNTQLQQFNTQFQQLDVKIHPSILKEYIESHPDEYSSLWISMRRELERSQDDMRKQRDINKQLENKLAEEKKRHDELNAYHYSIETMLQERLDDQQVKICQLKNTIKARDDAYLALVKAHEKQLKELENSFDERIIQILKNSKV
jgi:hypothetical protein